MGRNRTPTAILQLTGGYHGGHKDRERARALEPEQAEPLGDPPERLDEAARARWVELAGMAPNGVLKKRDRLVVEQIATLWSRMVRGELTLTGHRLLASLTAKLGLNPSDSSRVSVPKPAKQPAGGLGRFMPKGDDHAPKGLDRFRRKPK